MGLSQRRHFTGPDDFVFGTVRGTMQDENTMRDGLYEAMKKAASVATGAPVSRSSSTTCAIPSGRLAVQAFPLSEVKAYMGHADIQTTCCTSTMSLSTMPRIGSAPSSRTRAGTRLPESEVSEST